VAWRAGRWPLLWLSNSPIVVLELYDMRDKRKKKLAGPPAGFTLVEAPAKAREVGAPEGITPDGQIWLTKALASAAQETKRKEAAAAGRETRRWEPAAPATPPRALLATAYPPSLGKRGASRSCSSASPGSSGGGLSPPIDADGFQLVVRRMGKGRSRAKVPKKARERERDESL